METEAVLTRETYEAVTRALLHIVVPVDNDDLHDVVDMLYPCPTAVAVDELAARGLIASEGLVEDFATVEENCVSRSGHARFWTRKNIDDLAAVLLWKGRYTPEAKARLDSGVPPRLGDVGDLINTPHIRQHVLRRFYSSSAKLYGSGPTKNARG